MEVQRAAMVVADISGYTRFMKLHTVSLVHAEVIISELLEAVLDHTEHPLTLSKLEGDAAFLYVLLDGADDVRAIAQDVLRQVQEFIKAFKTRERELIACNVCACESCQTIGQLKIKAFLHVGDVAIKKIRQFEELGGRGRNCDPPLDEEFGSRSRIYSDDRSILYLERRSGRTDS
jgi:hypothetical protein